MAALDELTGTGEERSRHIIGVLLDAFEGLIEADPPAFRRKFRKMAADPFAFYRGSACLFYADVVKLEDPWADDRTSRVWIQGDLYAENFGTYMDSSGFLVFDVNASTRPTWATSPGTSGGWRPAWRFSGSRRRSPTGPSAG